MPRERLDAIRGELEERFLFLFKKQNAVKSRELVKKFIETHDTSFTVEMEMAIL